MNIENTPKQPLLKSEPENVDFGCLKPGEGRNVTLKVCGGPAEALTHTDQLQIVPPNFGAEDSEVQVTLLPGSAGDLIWDNVMLRGDKGEVSILVTARWEEQEVIEVTPTPPTQQIITEVHEERRWKGRKCSRCGKNFAYLGSGEWEQCNCNWYEIGVNMSSSIIRDLRSGIKELPSYIQELWRVILGKEKW